MTLQKNKVIHNMPFKFLPKLVNYSIWPSDRWCSSSLLIFFSKFCGRVACYLFWNFYFHSTSYNSQVSACQTGDFCQVLHVRLCDQDKRTLLQILKRHQPILITKSAKKKNTPKNSSLFELDNCLKQGRFASLSKMWCQMFKYMWDADIWICVYGLQVMVSMQCMCKKRHHLKFNTWWWWALVQGAQCSVTVNIGPWLFEISAATEWHKYTYVHHTKVICNSTIGQDKHKRK